jgi:transposase
MGKFKSYNRQQPYLFPHKVDDFIPESHLARIIDEIVENFDTSAIEGKYSRLGQKSYHPKLLLKLLFYGYTTGVRSGRKISIKCESDTAYMFLACMQKPDFRTINDFRKDNIESFEYFFLELLKICNSLGMIKVGELHVDGTKILADASKKKSLSKKGYEKWLSKIEEKIKEILKEVETADNEEDKLYGEKRGDELPGGLSKSLRLREKIKGVMNAMSDKEKINLTDNDAKNIKGGSLIRPNYNCQAGVTEDGVIVSGYVTNNASDSGELINVIDQAESNIEKTFDEILADSGYGTYDSYQQMEERGKIAYVSDQAYSKAKKNKYKDKLNAYDKTNFVYDNIKDEYRCPQGKILSYKGRSSEDNRKYRVYEGIACANCKVKNLCTKAKNRKIKREEREEIREAAINRLETDEGKAKYAKRGYTIEPVFGNLKHNLGYRRFNLRGLQKVNGEFMLFCLANNIQKIYKFRTSLNKAA